VDVFRRTLDGWVKLQTLTASDGVAGDRFGHSVAFGERYLFVGAPHATAGATSDAGAVYQFLYDANTRTWSQYAKLTATTPTTGAEYGYAISSWYSSYIRYLSVGEPAGASNKGVAYQYTNSSSFAHTFSLSATQENSAGAAGDRYGHAVDGTYVGAPGCDSNRGAVFDWDTKYQAPDGQAGDGFGSAIAWGYGFLLIGAPDAASSSGRVYVYDESGLDYAETLAPVYLTAGDRFGCSVSTYQEERIAIGADGSGTQPGYIVLFGTYGFDYPSSGWTDMGRMFGEAPASGNRFGASLTTQEHVFYTGAPGATVSGQTGAGQVETYSRAYYQDAKAYVYKKTDGVWGCTQVIEQPLICLDQDLFEDCTVSADGSRLVASRNGGTYGDASLSLLTYDWSGTEFVLKDMLNTDHFTSEPGEAETNVVDGNMSADGSLLAVAGPFPRGVADPFDNRFVDQAVSIPNADCSITEAGYPTYLTVNVNSTGSSADWSSGVCTCPLLYFPISGYLVGNPLLQFTSEFKNPTGTVAAFSVGIAWTGDDPAQNAYVWEYNTGDQKLYAWSVTGGGAKTAVYTSSAIGNATSYSIKPRMEYDANAGTVKLLARRSSSSYTTHGTFAIGFVPTRAALFARIASPTSANYTVQFLSLTSIYTIDPVHIRVYERSGDSWNLLQSLNPTAPATTVYSAALSPSGRWLAANTNSGIALYENIAGTYTFNSSATGYDLVPGGMCESPDTVTPTVLSIDYPAAILLRPSGSVLTPLRTFTIPDDGGYAYYASAASSDATIVACGDEDWNYPDSDYRYDGRVDIYEYDEDQPPELEIGSPVNKEQSVSPDTTISFFIEEDAGLTAGWTIEIYLSTSKQWVTAYVNGASPAFKPGWDGPASVVSQDFLGYAVTIDPNPTLPVNCTLIVRVTGTDSEGAPIVLKPPPT